MFTCVAALELPTSSFEFTLMAFSPSASVTSKLHVVEWLSGIFSTPFINMELSMSFVPVNVCVASLVGEVTGFTVGAAGGVVSKRIVTLTEGLSLLSESLDVTVKALFPSWSVSSTCQVVAGFTGTFSEPFIRIEAFASFVPVNV